MLVFDEPFLISQRGMLCRLLRTMAIVLGCLACRIRYASKSERKALMSYLKMKGLKSLKKSTGTDKMNMIRKVGGPCQCKKHVKKELFPFTSCLCCQIEKPYADVQSGAPLGVWRSGSDRRLTVFSTGSLHSPKVGPFCDLVLSKQVLRCPRCQHEPNRHE